MFHSNTYKIHSFTHLTYTFRRDIIAIAIFHTFRSQNITVTCIVCGVAYIDLRADGYLYMIIIKMFDSSIINYQKVNVVHFYAYTYAQKRKQTHTHTQMPKHIEKHSRIINK